MSTKQFTAISQGDIFFTIPNGQSVSDSQNFFGTSLVALEMPAAFDGTEISFQASRDNVFFREIYNTNSDLVSAIVAPDRVVAFVASDFAAYKFLKIVSNASETGERIVRIYNRPV